MPGELSNVLQNIINRAAKTPTGSTGEVARMRARFEKAGDAKVVLLDLSGSMGDLIGSSNMRKIEHAKIALTDLLQAHPKITIIGFGSYTKVLTDPQEIPSTSYGLMGSTNLTAGIEAAAKLKPRRTIILSDGLPDNRDTAEAAIDGLTGQVDCVYCGPDGHPAVAYLQSLARKGGGTQMTFDGCRELSPMIRGLLA